jgi:hypothetical protein
MTRRLKQGLLAGAVVAAALLACTSIAVAQRPIGGAARGVGGGPDTSRHNDYDDPATWLCRPGHIDACTTDLTTTVIQSDGSFSREPWSPDPNPSIDCFYVYPTVSPQLTLNSDMRRGVAEVNTVRAQFARFASRCRTFAPLYRQVTLAGLTRLLGAAVSPDVAARVRALAYDDVRDAWRHYLAHDNNGRGFVLIGHSQGAGVLLRLLREEIDGTPLQARLVSAILLGQNVSVPAGGDVGGTFHHVPLCRSPRQTGCVITYVSFRSTAPPPPDPMFGRVAEPGMVAACTNPADLAGGTGELHSYFPASRRTILGGADSLAWVSPPRAIETPWVSVPGLLTARCSSNANASGFLEVTVHHAPTDARTGDIGGDLRIGGRALPGWGLHLIDMNLAMGNLLDIVGQQSAVFRPPPTR